MTICADRTIVCRAAWRCCLSRMGLWGVRKLTALRRMRRVGKVRRWRETCQASLNDFLPLLMAGEAAERDTLARCVGTLRALLAESLPSDLLGQISQIPSPFRKQDLTPFDVLDLGRKWMVQFPERRQPVLVTGLRTAGSYFAPLLRAFLRSEGYHTVDSLTVRPNKGPSAGEQAELTRCAAAGYRTILVDDPPGSGDTFVQAISLLRSAGFAADQDRRSLSHASAPPRLEEPAAIHRAGGPAGSNP